MNIVHIGLGKCMTTLLQQEIFPNFKEYKKNYDYEDIVDIICNPKSDYSFVKKVKSGFYSHESLHGWNPLLWDRSSDIVNQSISFFSLKLISMANKTLTFFGISQRKKSYFYKFFLKSFIIHFVEKFFSARRFAFNLDEDILKEINEEKDYYKFLLEKSYKKEYLLF